MDEQHTVQQKDTSVFAILGLIFAFLMPLVGLILSIVGMTQTGSGAGKKSGRGVAIAGLVISILGMLASFLLLLSIIIAASNSSTTDSNSSTSQRADESNDSAMVMASINTPVRDGKFEFTVKGVECGKPSVGEGIVAVKAQGVFCVVSLSVKNIGDEAQSMSSSNQYLYNSEGQQYSATSTFSLENDLLYQSINPGNMVDGVILFDVTPGMSPSSIELHDGIFSDGVKVEL